MNHFLEVFDWAKFLAGLAILLFGLDLLEQSVSNIWETAQTYIKKYSKWLFRSIFIWLISTTILQSSSVVSLIIIAFVGSGVIGLLEWVGMIMWANIWTTIMDNLVAFFSFNDDIFDIKKVIRPMIGFGWILWFFFKKYRHLFYGIFGIGIIFLWLDFMKIAMKVLPEFINIDSIVWYPMVMFGILGIIMSAAMHSSSGTVLMTIAALNSWIINLPMWMAIIIWANIGTCITAIEWSLWKWSIAKKIAYSHIFFNIFTALFFSLIFYKSVDLFSYLNSVLSNKIWYETTSEKALILFTLLFDVVWTIIIYIFMGYFIKFLNWLVPEEINQNISLLYIDKIDGLTWKFALEALIKDIEYFYKSCKNYNLDQINIDHGQDSQEKFKKYNHLKNIYEKIMKYISNLDHLKLPQGSNTVKLQNIMNNCFYSVKYLEDIDHNIYKLYSSDNVVCREYFEYFVNKTNALYDMLNEDPRNKKAIHTLLSDIQIDDQYFIDKFINHNNDINSINGISDIITIHKYYYISCGGIVEADEILSNL